MRQKAFKLIDTVGGLDEDEIEKSYTDENIQYLNMLSVDFIGEASNYENISAKEYTKEIKKLYNIKKVWGRKLGDALIDADTQNSALTNQHAIEVLEGFISECPSPYYREHAKNQIKFYKSKAN